MAIGQAGQIITNSPTENAPINVTFDEPLTDPIIVLTGTNGGGNGFNYRVTDIQYNADGDATGFTFIMEEWEYLDGPHPAVETTNWIAVEEGVHTLPSGQVIEAGTTSATDGNSSVTLSGGFTDTPVVMTSVMSENDTTAVDSDAFNVTNTGFTVSLQEEEAEDGSHAAETVGYIAIQQGNGAVTQDGVDENSDTVGLGGTFTNAITVADTQTMNGGDPGGIIITGGNGTTSVDVAFKEEQSQDTETNHINETVGVITFEEGLIPCFTEGTKITTARGEVDVAQLVAGDMVLTRDQGLQPLRWISRTQLDTPRLMQDPHLRPVLLRKGSIAPGFPSADMWVSPQHRMLITGWQAQLFVGEDEVLVPAKAIGTAAADDSPVTYYHLLFDRHQVVFANDTPSESLHAGQISKSLITSQAREELFQILPDLRSYEAAYGPTARPCLSVRETSALFA